MAQHSFYGRVLSQQRMYSFSGVLKSQAGDYRLIQGLHIDCCNRMDGSEDLMIQFLKPNQPCSAERDYNIIHDRVIFHSHETSEGLIYKYYRKPNHIWPRFGKN